MLRKLYDWTMSLAAHRHAPWALGGVSFIESSVFPIPPDLLLMPMVLSERRKAWFYAAICTAASVAGGVAGWLIGYFLFEAIAEPILNVYGYAEKFEEFAHMYNEWGIWIVLFAGVTPFPYKVITIASGATGLALPIFIASSIAARGLRFFVVAGLLYWLGPPIREFVEKRLGLMFTLFLILLFGGFLAIKLL